MDIVNLRCLTVEVSHGQLNMQAWNSPEQAVPDKASNQNLGIRFKGRILRILRGSQGERLEGRGERVNTPEITSRKE